MSMNSIEFYDRNTNIELLCITNCNEYVNIETFAYGDSILYLDDAINLYELLQNFLEHNTQSI